MTLDELRNIIGNKKSIMFEFSTTSAGFHFRIKGGNISCCEITTNVKKKWVKFGEVWWNHAGFNFKPTCKDEYPFKLQIRGIRYLIRRLTNLDKTLPENIVLKEVV